MVSRDCVRYRYGTLMRATVLVVLADLHQGLAVDGVLRIPLADIARKHLSRHPSDFAVVQLQAPITVMAFDGTLRNETEFVYFKPPASANTTGGIWASAPELSDHNNTLPVPITLTESADILVDIEGTDSCFLFSSGIEKCDLGLWAGCERCAADPVHGGSWRFKLCANHPHDGDPRLWHMDSHCNGQPLRQTDSHEQPKHTCCDVSSRQPSRFAVLRLPAGSSTLHVKPYEYLAPASALIVLLPTAPASLRFNHARVWFYSEDLLVAAGVTVGVVVLASALQLRRLRRQWQLQQRQLLSLGASARSSVQPLFARIDSHSDGGSGGGGEQRRLGIHMRRPPPLCCRKQSSRARVSFLFLASGWLLVCFGMTPYIRFQLAPPTPYDDYIGRKFPEPYPGPFGFWLVLMGPGGLLMLMALLPVDSLAIRGVCLALVGVMFGVGTISIYFLVDVSKLDVSEPEVVVIVTFHAILLATATIVVATLLPMLLRRSPSRLLLLRAWRLVRASYVNIGASTILNQVLPELMRPAYRTSYFGTIYADPRGWITSLCLFGASLIVCGLLASARNRSRVFRLWRYLLRHSVSDMDAVLAALLGEMSPAHALQLAASTFVTIDFAHLQPTVFDPLQVACTERGAHGVKRAPVGESERDEARLQGLPVSLIENINTNPPPHVLLTALGACDAFVSHSSCDPPSLKFDALRRWAETETATTEGTTPRLWLDRLCLGAFASTVPLEVTVPLLPIFAAGSRQMLALVGSSYPSRLWCVLEVFVFLQVRACPRHATTHPPMHTKDLLSC